MALIPGTLPNDTCYGTPQDLLELFAQYLDVPAFALNSKVVFGTSSAGLTADVVWFDTTTATNPILKITVSGGFTDYIKNYITNAATVTIVGADSVLILDASDSGNTKRGLVSDIVPAAGSITPAQLAQPFTLGTAVASTSGTAIDFTGIPSWAKRITVMLNAVSAATTSALQIQIGDSGGVETTGYVVNIAVVRGAYVGAAGADNTPTSGFVLQYYSTSSNDSVSGHLILTNISGNIWIGSGVIGAGGTNVDVWSIAGTKTLSSVLDRVRLTTVAAATFDAGSVNIMYE